MLHVLKRHPIATSAHFDFTLALTFAVPAAELTPLLYPALTLDDFEGVGFVCIAIVQTRQMRPSFLPAWAGGDFMLTGYRIFVRYRTPEGKTLRGLQVLRSDTDRPGMVLLGNLFTHYRYQRARIVVERNAEVLSVKATSSAHTADLDLRVTATPGDVLPATSPFVDIKTARRFAGPMPYTFSYEAETRSIVRIEGRRRGWKPRMVAAEVREASYLKRFSDARLASAFMVQDIPYSWQRGVVTRVPA